MDRGIGRLCGEKRPRVVVSLWALSLVRQCSRLDLPRTRAAGGVAGDGCRKQPATGNVFGWRFRAQPCRRRKAASGRIRNSRERFKPHVRQRVLFARVARSTNSPRLPLCDELLRGTPVKLQSDRISRVVRNVNCQLTRPRIDRRLPLSNHREHSTIAVLACRVPEPPKGAMFSTWHWPRFPLVMDRRSRPPTNRVRSDGLRHGVVVPTTKAPVIGSAPGINPTSRRCQRRWMKSIFQPTAFAASTASHYATVLAPYPRAPSAQLLAPSKSQAVWSGL